LATLLQGRVVKFDGQPAKRCRLRYLLLELLGAGDGDLLAIAGHGHAQGRFDSVKVGATGKLELAAIIADG